METLKKNPLVFVVAALILGLVTGGLLFNGGQESHTDHSADESGATEWTCSMHPQIRQSESGDCPICGMDLIPVGGASSAEGATPYESVMSAEAVALAGVLTAPVRRENPQSETYLTGRVAIDERRIETLAATFPGRIEQLYIDFTGQQVKKGERLATLYSPELITAQQELLEAARVREAQPALYVAAREKLRLWRIGEEQVDSFMASGKIQTEFDVRAEASGVVSKRHVSVGDYVSRGTPLFEVVDLQKLWVLLDAYEGDLPTVTPGSQVQFEAASIPGEMFTAEVAFVDPVVNPQKRTVSVRLDVENKADRLRPDVLVRAKVVSRLAESEALLIPKTAVLWTGKRSVVYVRMPGGPEAQFQMREVTLGPRAGDNYVIESGLEEGESVVSQGAFAVDAATQLQGGHSMLSRPKSSSLDVPDEVLAEIGHIVHAYFRLKNALVADALDSARTEADHTVQATDRVRGDVLTGTAKVEWDRQKAGLRAALHALTHSSEIKAARSEFLHVSERVIQVVETFRPAIGQAYVQFCPMALDFQGAHWLSEVDDVLNPYFGEQMLNCGDTVRPIVATGSSATPQRAPSVHRH